MPPFCTLPDNITISLCVLVTLSFFAVGVSLCQFSFHIDSLENQQKLCFWHVHFWQLCWLVFGIYTFGKFGG